MSWLTEIASHPIRRVSADLGLRESRGGSLTPCPSCGSTKRGDEDPRGPLGVGGDGKGWACHASGCDATGDLADLLSYSMFGGRVRSITRDQLAALRDRASSMGLCGEGRKPAALVSSVPSTLHRQGPPQAPVSSPAPATGSGGGSPFTWRDTLAEGAHRALWADPDAAPVLAYLTGERGLGEDCIRRWGLGALVMRKGGRVVERWLTIPLMDESAKPVNVKFRRVPGPCLYCSPDGHGEGPGCRVCAKTPGRVPMKPKYRVCAGRPMPLYGVHNLKDTASPVIVVEGELDVVAADQYGWGLNVVSSPSGGTADWPDAWLDPMEPFPSFLMAQDADDVGKAGALKLADKLGRYRCARTSLPYKDLGECLSKGVPAQDLRVAFDASEGMLTLTLAQPHEYGSEIEDLITNPSKLIGMQSSIGTINSAWGGLLPGLYVFTGETGEGKTTFTTWLAWDLLPQTPVLMTSFEQRPIGTVQKLLRMEVGGDFTKVSAQERADGLKRLTARGLYIVKKYGDVTDTEIIEAVRYARRRRGCKIAMLDHLDFMVRNRSHGESEREAKERVVRTLATIGVEEDISIILICHPNNLSRAQQRRVEIGDLKGASAIRQDAHAAVVVEKVAPTKNRSFPAAMLHFDKVRSEFGQAGCKRLLAFDPLACVYAQRWEDTPAGSSGKRIVTP